MDYCIEADILYYLQGQIKGRGYSSSIPKPVIERLGKSDTLKFVINDDDNSVELISGKTHVSRKGTKVN